MDTLWSKYSSEQGDGGWRFGEEEELLSSGYNCPEPHLHLPLTRPLPPGSREIQLAVPGAYEKPQSVPLQPTTVEPGLPATFIFHMNPVLSPRLNIALQEKLLVSHVSELWRGGKSRMSPRRRRLQSAWEARLSSHTAPCLSSPQSGPSDELESQTSKMEEASILLSSLPLNQESTRLMNLEEVRFSLVLRTPTCPMITKRGLGPTLASYLSTKGHRLYVCAGVGEGCLTSLTQG